MAWYPLNGDLKDKTGFSGDLSIEGTVNLTIDGKIGGKAPNFIGVASNGLYINNFIQDVENWQSNFSYACWVYINSQEGNWQYLISTGRDCGSYGCNLQIRSSDLVICYETKNQQHYSTGISVPLQVWTHITMTCDDNFIYFYVNGEYKTKVENKGFGYTEAKNQALYIGKMSYNSTVNHFPLNGSIQDVRIYNHCLSDAEIKEISKGLVLHYTMDNLYGNSNILQTSGLYPLEMNGIIFTPQQNGGLKISGENQTKEGYGSAYVFPYGSIRDDNYHSLERGTYVISLSGSDYYKLATTDKAKFYWRIRVDSPYGQQIECSQENGYGVFTLTQNYEKVYIGFGFYPLLEIVEDTIFIKLEKGTYPTIWCPNIADPLASSYGLDKVYDSSGYGNDGVPVGDVLTLSNSKKYEHNALIKSQNIDDYTSMSGASYIRSKCEVGDVSQITISWWANIYSFGHQGSGMFTSSQDGEIPTNYLQAGFNQYDAVFRFLTTDDMSNSLSATNLIVQNEWHMYSLVFDGETIKSYRDGMLFQSKDLIGKLKPFTQIFIGLSNAGAAIRKTIGEWSDFRVYTTALSEKDILKLYQETQKIDNKGNLYCSELNELERRVEYLESHSYDGAANYINTKVNPTNNTAIEIKINVPSDVEHSWDRLYGCHNYFRTQASDGYGNKQNFYWDYPDNAQVCTITFEYDTDITIKQDKNYLFVNGELQYTFTDGEWAVNNSIYLFYAYASDRCGIFKLYYCKIWEDGILVRDFLPAISTEEGHIGEACLFDTVENKYYYNQGTRKFTTNLDESTTNIDFTSKGIVNTDYIIEGKDKTKILNDGNIIEVNNLYEN